MSPRVDELRSRPKSLGPGKPNEGGRVITPRPAPGQMAWAKPNHLNFHDQSAPAFTLAKKDDRDRSLDLALKRQWVGGSYANKVSGDRTENRAPAPNSPIAAAV